MLSEMVSVTHVRRLGWEVKCVDVNHVHTHKRKQFRWESSAIRNVKYLQSMDFRYTVDRKQEW